MTALAREETDRLRGLARAAWARLKRGDLAPGFSPLYGPPLEMQGFALATYRPSYRHPAVTTCRLGGPGHILGSAATGTARSAVGGPFQTFLAGHRASGTGASLYHQSYESLFNNNAARRGRPQALVR